MYKKITIFSSIFILFDQVIKILINNMLELYEYKVIIKDFFNITNIQNTGAAWSILSGNRILLIGISLVALVFIFLLFIKNQKLNKFYIITYSMLTGGIIGNLIDRIIYGYVIDYLDFNIFKYKFPVFNFADICIVVSVILIVINSIMEEVCKKSK